MSVLLLFIGFVVLVKGADALLEGGMSLGRKIGISELVIGLTVIAFGTSLPELIVNIFSSARGEGDLALGNVAGSNIANILLILGAGAIIRPLTVHRTIVYREIIFNVIASLMLVVLITDVFLFSTAGNPGLDRIDGIVLMSYFILFLYYSFNRRHLMSDKEIYGKRGGTSTTRAVLQIAGGGAGLFLGGQWIVGGAIDVANWLGASEAFIGATVVAVGTSLPELTTTLVAVRKGNVDVAVGNAVGSNLFNTFWVLGLSAFITPITLKNETLVDVFVAAAGGIILFLTMVFGRHRHQISRGEGAAFVILYGAYLITAAILGLND